MKKIYIVGLGPGNEAMMTAAAREAIDKSSVVVGYEVYVDLIRPLLAGKTVATTPMKREVDRCQMALEYALAGETVSMVCSGDAGVYGMAGVMMEVAREHPEVEMEVVCGITAACSAAAVLGAPLIHDFAVISLSDLLTPWEKIEKRLRLAADADFVICLYNPSSKKRSDYLQRACDLVLQHQSPETCCGYVRNIGREGEQATLCTLSELRMAKVDMFTTVIIGNSQTKVINGRLVTPRGYKNV
ncbi:precorrin-3B C(17)-methyltransferase [Bianquea renquensis]|jgi:precorrin-3B C(17)-methyltransferase|uniref:Precorrin-3B C(17)-methyltransferase n=1 Tax=Bianquea renquensis TaxID=2763661 RepID=A0A926DN99_9FIRM|nr:precorrin-3B C(17)-methyltransferase [Bianquea renquensis]MBC8542125.1 precorrin-3B C(17)-methyltransferase [Bianquea renquensis]